MNQKVTKAFSGQEMNCQKLGILTPIDHSVESGFAAAVRHSLAGQGSFSRAILTTGISDALGLQKQDSEGLGAAIELFHLASLVLDDLPCMDNATTRRSQTCTHLLYGENNAILSALGFINHGYYLLWRVFASCDRRTGLEAAKLLDQCLGFVGVLNGQARDISYSGSDVDATEVLEIARLKTGSLLRLCLLLPAVLADSDRMLKLYLAKLSDLWGMAYQITDDLKDIFLGESLSGKTSCRDESLGRPNMALAAGVDGAVEMLGYIITDADDCIEYIAANYPQLVNFLNAFHEKIKDGSEKLLKAHAAA